MSKLLSLLDNAQGILFPHHGQIYPGANDIWKEAEFGVVEAFGPIPNSPVPGTQASGSNGEYLTNISVLPGRIEISASKGGFIPPQTIGRINNYVDTLDFLTSALGRIAIGKGFSRCAIIATFGYDLGSDESFANVCNKISQPHKFSENQEDIIIQYNEKKKYDGIDIFMNRIVTVSTGSISLMSKDFSNMIPRLNFGFMSIGEEKKVINVRIDINSATNMDVTENIQDMIKQNKIELLRIIEEMQSYA